MGRVEAALHELGLSVAHSQIESLNSSIILLPVLGCLSFGLLAVRCVRTSASYSKLQHGIGATYKMLAYQAAAPGRRYTQHENTIHAIARWAKPRSA